MMKIKFLFLLLFIGRIASAQTILLGNYIKVSGTGGIPPYTYSLDNIIYQTNDTFKFLSPNTYTVYVKDSKGCIKTAAVKLYPRLRLFLINKTANSIEVQGSGGVPYYSNGAYKYYYSINNGSYTLDKTLFTGLTSGTYTIKVRDSKANVVSIVVVI